MDKEWLEELVFSWSSERKPLPLQAEMVLCF